MKKFFSLLCATLLVFSASAAPVAKKAELVKKAPVAVEQMQKVQFEEAQSAKTFSLENAQLSNQLSATPALKVSNQKAPAKAQAPAILGKKVVKEAKQKTAFQAAAPAKAPQAQASYEIVDVTAVICDWTDYETDMMYTLSDANGDIYQFDIYYTGSFELGHTYTYADMDKTYSCYATNGKGYAFETAEFTLTENEKGLKHIVATITVPAFDKQFNITWDQPEPQSKTIVASDFSMTDYGTDMFFVLTDSDGNQFRFDVLYTGSFEFDKTYTLADMDSDYSWYKLATGGGVTYTEASFTITEDQDELLHVVAAVVLSNGNSYEITYDEKAFVPTGVQINVNATNYKAEYISYYREYSYTASNEDFDINIWVYTDTELGTFDEDVDIEGSYLQEAGGGDYVIFHSVVTPIVVAQDEDGNKSLTGSLYAENGDEYVFNLTYEKPDAKEITLVADTLDFFTKMLSAGYYTVSGYNVDSTYEFSFYFISKSITGNFTEEDMDAYSTWVDQKDGKKAVVSYQNLSAANIQVTLVKDTVYYVGTMTLATNDGQEANITLNLSCPYKQEWGEWTDFAPFDKNTGKYAFNSFFNSTQYQTKIPVQERKDNTGLKQYKLEGWGKGLLSQNGTTLIINRDADNKLTIPAVNTGASTSGYAVWTSDAYTLTGGQVPQGTYDPETGIFSMQMISFLPDYNFYNWGAAEESFVMDQTILERDTVDIVSTALKYNDSYLASNKIVIFYANDVPNCYLFRVTSANATSVDGTFKWSEGGINDPNSYFSVSGTDKNYFQDGEFTVVTNDKDIALTGWMIGVDEKYYRLDMSYTAPTERDTVRFSGQGVTISECVSSQTGVQTGWFYEVADASTGYEFLLQSTVKNEKFGTFSYADKTLGSNYYNVFDPAGGRQQFKEGSITVTEGEDGSITLVGELIAEDEKVYVLNFVQAAGVLNYDTDAPFDATFAYSDMDATIANGVISISATNAEGLTIGLELYADPAATEIPAGVYTISDTQEAGTALQSVGVAGGYLTECWAGTRGTSGIEDCWFMVKGTITLEYDEYDKLKVVVNAKNSYDQPVTALVQYEKLEPKSSVDIDNAEFSVYEGYMEKYGIVNFYGGNDNYGFDLYAYGDTIVGDFANTIDFMSSYLESADGELSIIDVYSFNVAGEGKALTLTASFLGSDTIQYNISATGYYGYIYGDAVEGYVGEFAMENVTLLQATKSQVMINGFNEAGDTVAIVFDAKFSKTAGTIVEPQAGEYEAIMASTGFTAEYDVNPSFVGNEDGVWFIQSGKLIIAEDGSMAFAGVNSYDAPVAIDFTVPVGPATDYYLVGWINGAAYGIEGDIDNFGDYHFVDGKVKATFNELSYVQVKDNNKQIYGTDSYIAPVEEGNETLVANGPEKIAINGGVEYEYTLVVNADGSLTLSYAVVTTGLRNAKANVKAAKQIKNGQIVIVRENKEYNILGAAL